ncbi:MAG TPA: hypothetical protein PKL78_14660 [Anaerolineales bacterium]|nr:hypothetical protein [Anaerolineales bacterium]HNO31463.1 hypothetical protein [Anaerolineales bacterium]
MKAVKKISLFERITPNWLSYWLFWPIVGLLSFIGSEIVIRFYAEKYLLITRMIFAACIAIFPLIVIILSRQFRPTMKSLSDLAWDNAAEFEDWCTEKEWRIFSSATQPAKVVVTVVVFAGVVTILIIGLPLRDLTASLLGLGGFVIVMSICGMGGFVLIELLITLVDLVRRDMHVPFFLLPHPAFTRLQNYYSLSAVFVTGSYVLLVVAVWQGPYGLTLGMLVWLAILSFYPFSMFIWSTFQIHTLMQKAKQVHIETANSRVQAALKRTMERNDTKDYEQLEKAMNIQIQVQKISEWPIAVSGTVTFLVTIVPAIVQTIIAIINAIKN